MVRKNPTIAWKLIYPEETKKIRAYADYYAYINYGLYLELCKFEDYFAWTFTGNLKIFIEKNIENVTNIHLS